MVTVQPATRQWTLTGSLNAGRSHHTATLLPNGKVLAAGGPASAELYDPGIVVDGRGAVDNQGNEVTFTFRANQSDDSSTLGYFSFRDLAAGYQAFAGAVLVRLR